MKPRQINRALGIQTRDIIRTSYSQKVFVVHSIIAPHYVITGLDYFIILDHPEISLTLIEEGSTPRSDHYSYINDVRQVGDRWFTALNDEIFVERPACAPVIARSLLDLIDPPNAAAELPIPPPYTLNPAVAYTAGPGRAWHCAACGVDFNTAQPSRFAVHACGTNEAAREIYYVQAPALDDRRMFTSYYCMTIDHTRYEPSAYQPERAAA
jgi:hypothetical protein